MLLPSQGGGTTVEGYTLRCGIIPANPSLPDNTNVEIYVNFSSSFKTNCYGVVLTQSYGNRTDGHESTGNLAVTSFNKNGFTINAGNVELKKPIYYIAFGV